MIKEVWKIIPRYKKYEVSNCGRIRNIATGYVLNPYWSGRKRKQYLVVTLGGRVNRKIEKLHRLILEAFIGESKGLLGCHKDDNPSNNNLSNLFWGTPKQNIVFCERHGATKFSKSIVKMIRDEFTGRWGQQQELAVKYNTSPSYISYIVNNKLRARK